MESKTKQYCRQTEYKSGAEDEDYFNRHFWTIKMKPEPQSGGGSKRYKSSGYSSFNTESGEASINLNTNVGNNDEDEIKRMEVECRERELEAQEYRQRQEDIMFYLQPYDHLTWEQRMAMEEARAEIKAKYNLPY
ncbi:hypothetical protein Tco_1520198 [Tanacetum coccineum]